MSAVRPRQGMRGPGLRRGRGAQGQGRIAYRHRRSGGRKSELLGYVARSVGDAEIIRIEGLESESAIGLAGLHRLLLFHPNGRGVLRPLSVAP